jgi:hypothetical protein
MGLLTILAVVIALGWANWIATRSLRLQAAGWGWWIAVLLGWICGTIVGVWGGFFLEYQAGPTLRLFGAPIPTAVFHFEGLPGQEHWVDFVTPAPTLIAATDVLLITLLSGSLVGLVFWLCGKRKKNG